MKISGLLFIPISIISTSFLVYNIWPLDFMKATVFVGSIACGIEAFLTGLRWEEDGYGELETSEDKTSVKPILMCIYLFSSFTGLIVLSIITWPPNILNYFLVLFSGFSLSLAYLRVAVPDIFIKEEKE